jgi:hypothetical protein
LKNKQNPFIFLATYWNLSSKSVEVRAFFVHEKFVVNVKIIFFRSTFDENSAVKETLQAGPGPEVRKSALFSGEDLEIFISAYAVENQVPALVLKCVALTTQPSPTNNFFSLLLFTMVVILDHMPFRTYSKVPQQQQIPPSALSF